MRALPLIFAVIIFSATSAIAAEPTLDTSNRQAFVASMDAMTATMTKRNENNFLGTLMDYAIRHSQGTPLDAFSLQTIRTALKPLNGMTVAEVLAAIKEDRRHPLGTYTPPTPATQSR